MQISYYDRIGKENIKKLIHDFYQEIRKDELLKPMYKNDLDGAEESFIFFWCNTLADQICTTSNVDTQNYAYDIWCSL